MIFVTVGNTDPFDRLIQAVERWSIARTPREEICAQIGAGKFVPTSFPVVRFFDPPAFESKLEQAELVISHAGMGTIITALERRKPLLVMPKRASLGEQRNEHQLATVEHLCEKNSIWVARDETEFPSVLDGLLETIRSGDNPVQTCDNDLSNASLLGFVRDFVHHTGSPADGNGLVSSGIPVQSRSESGQGGDTSELSQWSAFKARFLARFSRHVEIDQC